MFSMNSRAFAPAAVLEEARSSAERIYSVFRWAVTPRFLQEYGGKT